MKVGGLFGSSPCDVRQGLVRNEFLKEALCRRNKNAVDHCLLPPPVKENSATFGIVVAECLESRKVFSLDLCGVLHFNCDELRGRVDDEVNLQSRPCSPEIERVAFARIVEPGAKMLMDESFKSHAVDFLRAVERTFRTECAIYAGIEEVDRKSVV